MHPLNPPYSASARRRLRAACAALGWEFQGHLSPQLERSVVLLHPTGGRMARWVAVAAGLTSPVAWRFYIDPASIPQWEQHLLRRLGIAFLPREQWADALAAHAELPACSLLLAPGTAPAADEWATWLAPFRSNRWWIVPVGIDRRRTKVHIHHGFHWGPYDDRNVHYVQRYFRYFRHDRNPER
jgi:hypothetical protein